MNRSGSCLRPAAIATLAAVFTLGAAAPVSAQEAAHQGRKSPPLALALSVVLPGAGQVYNGQYVKGAVMFGGAVLTAGALLLTASDVFAWDDDTSGTGTHVVAAVGAGILLWSWIDAPLSARAINRRLDAGGVALEMGPRLDVGAAGRRADLSLVRIGF